MSKQEIEISTCAPDDLGAPVPPISTEQAARTARGLKALADPVRLQLVSLIAAHEGAEACVCDLTGAFDLSGPTISHHLKVLREAGILSSERRGTWVHYRLEAEVLGALVSQVEALGTPVGGRTLVSAAP